MPTGWREVPLGPGAGVLSVPPGFQLVRGDKGAASAALFGPHGAYLGYLNATPLESGESLANWATLRLGHLLGDDAVAAREIAAIEDTTTRGVQRSCVIDDYVTKVGRHHFQEVACLVEWTAGDGVVVAAVPPGDPAHVWAVLERAAAAYPVGRPAPLRGAEVYRE